MKKLPLILSIISFVGLMAVAVILLTRKPESNTKNDNSIPTELKIAYVNTDSVLVNYQLALELNQEFIKKQQEYNTDFGKKRSDFEKKAVAFQEKVRSGGFLTQERAVKEQEKLMGQEEEIKRLDYELSNKLSEMEAAINKQLVDSIVNYIKIYNEEHNYTYILSNSGNIIVGDQHFNISKDILEGLNARYYSKK